MCSKTLILIALAALSHCEEITEIRRSSDVLMMKLEFQNWAFSMDKSYEGKAEFDTRFGHFLENKKEIERHNKSGSSYKKGLNQFADLSSEEFMRKYTTRRPPLQGRKQSLFARIKERVSERLEDVRQSVLSIFGPAIIASGSDYLNAPKTWEKEKLWSLSIPDQIDWHAQGKVTEPRDQQHCGGCYSFSSVAALESAYAIKTGNLENFSEQHLINCGPYSGIGMLFGCNGGSVITAMEFFKKYGVHSYAQFPYVGFDDHCQLNAPPLFKIVDHNDDIGTVEKLAAELVHGPVAVAIEVTPEYQLYEDGVFDLKFPCGFYLNHGVTVVGYDRKADKPFFRLKNSWGMKWGEHGFFRAELNDPGDSGFCGITKEGARPIL